YALTPKAVRRVDDAASRIYRTSVPEWNGQFDLVVVDPPASRTARSRLANALNYLGYGQLNATTWIAPRPATELDSVLADAGVTAERFVVAPTGANGDGSRLVRRAWDLDRLAAA